jgi:predicted nucleic acid-binding protein
MTRPKSQPTDVSVRQFVADSGSVTRGLRQGHAYTLTLNGPLERAGRVAVLQHVESTFEALPYDHHAARFYGQICAAVRAAGRQPRKRASDLMIAATAASNALPLYTANPDDFRGSERFVELVGVPGRPNDL